MYGVLTWDEKMPISFPLNTAQNAGNMVHAQAPFRLLPNSVGPEFGYAEEGFRSFTDFVNARCAALIVPYANIIRSNPDTDWRGFKQVESLSRFEVPIVPFGVGAQAPTTDIDGFELGPGRAAFVKFLSDKCSAISVRGEFTRQVKSTGQTRTFT